MGSVREFFEQEEAEKTKARYRESRGAGVPAPSAFSVVLNPGGCAMIEAGRLWSEMQSESFSARIMIKASLPLHPQHQIVFAENGKMPAIQT